MYNLLTQNLVIDVKYNILKKLTIFFFSPNLWSWSMLLEAL